MITNVLKEIVKLFCLITGFNSLLFRLVSGDSRWAESALASRIRYECRRSVVLFLPSRQ